MNAKSLAAAALVCLSAWATSLFAQDKQLGSEAEPAFVVVEGLAPSDLLNVRATASPTGLLLDRVQNGTMLKSFGCTPVNGHDWCRIEGVNDPGIKGWTPARYLLASDDAPPAEPSVPPAAAAQIVPDTLPAPPSEADPARQTGPTTMDAALAGAVKAAAGTALALAAGRPAEVPHPIEPAPPHAAEAAVASDAMAQPSGVVERPSAAPVAPATEAGRTAADATPPATTAAPAVTPSGAQDGARSALPSAARQLPAAASVEAEPDTSASPPQASLTILSPAVLVLCGFPMVFMAAMAAIASFGSFTFTAPFERVEAAA